MLRKIIVSMLFVTFFSITLSALEVDVDEISSSKKIDFINYEGRGGKFETVDQILSIGYQLAYMASRGSYNERFRYHMKYSVVRVDGAGDKSKYSADILFIDKDARVDHIKNVRRIISSYLEQLYNYTPEQARALALYVTYYNAIHRGDMGYFESRYREKVLDYITEKNAGIAIRYDQWPGKTALVIPLTTESKRGKIGTIDPFEISDEKVKKEIKKEKDTVDDRRELVKIKEDEIGKRKEDLDKDKKKTEDRKKETEKKRTDVEKKKEEVLKEKEKIAKEKEDVKKITNPEERKKKEDEIKKKEDIVKEKETTTKKEDKKVKQEEDRVKKDETEIKKTEDDLKKKEEDTKKDKEELTGQKDGKVTDTKKDKTATDEITKKEDELKKKEKELDKREDKLRDKQTDQNVFGLKIYYLEIKEYLDGGHYNNNLYMINATTKKIDFKSPVTNICGRRYDIYSGGIAVITHQGSHTSGHRLTLIDREKLTLLKTGTDNVFWRSFIEVRDGFIFVIVKDGEDYYLGKFDADLKLVAKSKDKIHQNSFITFYEESIFINREDMTIIVLKKSDLSLEGVIKP
ncbi:MAG TPA: P83/100 family protein [Spirochaetota bacterium]|nr:P83/100 family protein [Spirochaetota bacterium]